MGRVRQRGNHRLGQYVQRRAGGKLEIRYPLPADVRHAFLDPNGNPRKQLIKSLGTEDVALANSKAAIQRVTWDAEVRAARRGSKALTLGDYLKRLYDSELDAFQPTLKASETDLLRAKLGPIDPRRSPANGELFRSAWGNALLSDDPKEKAAVAGWAADRYFRTALGREPDRNTDEYAEVVDQCALVIVDALVAQKEILEGRSPGTPVSSALVARAPHSEDGNKATSENGNRALSDYFESCFVPGVPDRSERNIPVKRQTVGLFAELIDDLPLYAITKANLWEFHDKLLKLPDRRYLSGNMRSLGAEKLSRLVDAGELRPLNPKTVNKHLTNMRAILKWGVKRRDIHRFVGDDVRAEIEDTDEIARSFTRDELQRIFELPLFSGCRGERTEAELLKPGNVLVRNDRFWIPFALLFTGARVSEIAGLECADVMIEAEIPHFVIRPNTRRRLKNKQSARVVPIHPLLLRAGFATFARDRIASGEPHFFSLVVQLHYRDKKTGELRPKSLSQALILRKFNRTFLSRADAKANGGSMKCFRHTFERESTNKIADVELRRRLTGREVGSSAKHYTSSLPTDPHERLGLLKLMRTEIGKIAYEGVDLSHLLKDEVLEETAAA